MTTRIHSNNNAAQTHAANDAAPTSNATPAAARAGAQHARSTPRGPDVTVDHGSQSSAQQRLRSMQQRASVGAPANQNATRSFEALVANYRSQLLAGHTPTAPTAPRLPHESGASLMGRLGVDHPDFSAALRAAEHARHANEPFSAAEWAFDHVSGGNGLIADLAVHAAVEGAEIPHLLHMAATGAAEHVTLLGGISTVLTAVAIADATSLAVQDIANIARGRHMPSAAILQTLREEIPRRAEQWMRTNSERAEHSFNDGARRAAQGLAPDASRSSDRAYMEGIARGREYRGAHGDAYTNVVNHNRALEQAAREVAAMPHASATPSAPREHFVPVTSLEPSHVGVDFHIDG